MKAKCIMVQGTASSVGKSLIAAGLCRVLKQDGLRVAPFKSQNMALNSFITSEGKEMGRAQVVQAEAAGVEPHVEMNPVLLKPTADTTVQVVINGEVYANMTASEYQNFKPHLKDMICETYERLALKNDIIVIEGAGSPAEINLRENDFVNMGMAEIADAPVILVGDIDKGGVFASLAGTMLLLEASEKARVKGVIINKFRGDPAILEPGLKMLENIIKIPVLGVIPHIALNIDDEDGFLAEKYENSRNCTNAGTVMPDITDIVVVRLPHISNDTDFNAMENIPGVRVRYISSVENIGVPDMIILPGTKNTAGDLKYLRESGLEERILDLNRSDVPVFGICGGFQMLGMEIMDPSGAESGVCSIKGMGLLDAVTTFQPIKTTTRVKAFISGGSGLIDGLDGLMVTGYEIHMGATRLSDGRTSFLTVSEETGKAANRTDGACNKAGTVFGTYIHGIFDGRDFTIGLVNNLRRKKGLPLLDMKTSDHAAFKEQQYDKLASVLRKHLDLDAIYEIMNCKLG